ncbi:hypothetical protein FA13DRAFT_1795426 [Coprinellus micaceus]|uniref:Uncharacterized protein n=1 Tax=Coprinellus micaceus TaxID=71717 RepID=A0A4Y7SY18_COPMI|nr:hypothetical protein FA13DRAFT_1795426 [Coprinellus micaceus]
MSKGIDQGVASTKETLKAKGVEISASGVSMKTDKRLEREDYIDATKRGFMKTLEASSAAKYLDQSQGKRKGAHHISRSISGASDKSATSESSEKKRRLPFGRKKADAA